MYRFKRPVKMSRHQETKPAAVLSTLSRMLLHQIIYMCIYEWCERMNNVCLERRSQQKQFWVALGESNG